MSAVFLPSFLGSSSVSPDGEIRYGTTPATPPEPRMFTDLIERSSTKLCRASGHTCSWHTGPCWVVPGSGLSASNANSMSSMLETG